MQTTTWAIRGASVALLGAVVASCTPQTTDASRDPVASVTITPTAAELGVGAAVPFQATVKDGSDNVLADRRVVWNSSDTTIAVVSDLGVVTARRAGSAQVAASAEGKYAIAVVTVVPPPAPPSPPAAPAPPGAPVASVAVIPSKVQLRVGETLRLQAVAYDHARAPLAGRSFTWVTSKPSVATVDAAGLVTAVGKGSATITATSGGRSGSSSVTVSRP